ncbi:Uma2 family endonuclease [Nocardia sp. NBC_00511]|uniref:Uma2 family endonuclease n=1 Tax=Nocardia sp. NBC_00511 TaxID=2903591 RepID=UPI0030DEBD86
MPTTPVERPDLPERMTWEELGQLPDEIAGEIELWDGRPVWLRRAPFEHQEYTNMLWAALRRCARAEMSRQPERCWRVATETNIFFGRDGKSDFVTPDFLAFRCLEHEYEDVRATDVLMVGEVLSKSNSEQDIEAKKSRYAAGGIPWYWEVTLARNPRRISSVRTYALETGHGTLPDGVSPLHPANYLIAGEWIADVHDGITFDYPFPIRITWEELEF